MVITYNIHNCMIGDALCYTSQYSGIIHKGFKTFRGGIDKNIVSRYNVKFCRVVLTEKEDISLKRKLTL